LELRLHHIKTGGRVEPAEMILEAQRHLVVMQGKMILKKVYMPLPLLLYSIQS
uniref:Uncharacterized protein n=1 Tax=Aegilops tauschii subsp. strangulata TaxID=200361 RepID=A0A453CD17_AEGTS